MHALERLWLNPALLRLLVGGGVTNLLLSLPWSAAGPRETPPPSAVHPGPRGVSELQGSQREHRLPSSCPGRGRRLLHLGPSRGTAVVANPTPFTVRVCAGAQGLAEPAGFAGGFGGRFCRRFRSGSAGGKRPHVR